MTQSHFNVLFVSNRNTARSIFAEAVMNRLGRRRFTGFSAGIEPAGELDPMVLDILHTARYPTRGLRPKGWTEFASADAPPLGFVFTLCDLKVGEPLPRWSGWPISADWRYPDPDALHGAEWQRRKALGAILAGLERQLGAFMLLPFQALDRISLHSRVGALQHAGADSRSDYPSRLRRHDRQEPAAAERPQGGLRTSD